MHKKRTSPRWHIMVKNSHRNIAYTWPTQPKPPPSDWRHWQHIIRTAWINKQRELHKTHLQSKLFFHHNSDTLYKHVIHNTYFKYIRRLQRTQRSNPFTLNQNHGFLPPYSIPVLVKTLNLYSPEIEQQIQIQPNASNPQRHFINFLQNTGFPSNGYHIAQSIRNNNTIDVSDASVMQISNIGTASWIITNCTSDAGACIGDHAVPI